MGINFYDGNIWLVYMGPLSTNEILVSIWSNPDLYGWIGNLLLAICCIPQAMKAHRDGNSRGISYLFILTWFVGECLAFGYHLNTSDKYPQIFNYIINIGGTSVILWYRVFERKSIGKS